MFSFQPLLENSRCYYVILPSTWNPFKKAIQLPLKKKCYFLLSSYIFKGISMDVSIEHNFVA